MSKHSSVDILVEAMSVPKAGLSAYCSSLTQGHAILVFDLPNPKSQKNAQLPAGSWVKFCSKSSKWTGTWSMHTK